MKSNGQIAYEAFHAHFKGKDPVADVHMPAWSILEPDLQAAWEHVGNTIQQISGGAMHGIGYHDGWVACMDKYNLRTATE